MNNQKMQGVFTMRRKMIAQLSLLIWSVLSCSEVPVKVAAKNKPATDNSFKQSPVLSVKDTPSNLTFDDSVFIVDPAQRALFSQAEQLLAVHDDVGYLALAPQLVNYPLYPYLHSKWLRKNLSFSTEIEPFLAAYKNTYYADLVRHDWIPWLAKAQDWAKIAQYYQPERDSHKPELQCYFALAQYYTGNQQQAFKLAEELWLKNTTKTVCSPLFAVFMQSGGFSDALLWKRLNTGFADKKATVQVVSDLLPYLSGENQQAVDSWLRAHNQPTIVLSSSQWDSQQPRAGDIFAHGISRLVATNLTAAINSWDAQKGGFNISQEAFDKVEQALGMALVSGSESYAYSRLIQASQLTDEKARHTMVRAALKEQNWANVLQATYKLTPDDLKQNKWQYWQARALEQTGKTAEARTIFSGLTLKTDFYAILAAYRLNQPYRAQHNPVPVTNQDIKLLQQQPDVKAVAEWFALGRKEDAMLAWWSFVKHSTPQQIMAAAKLAQHWQQPRMAALTIAKADYWQDLELRFPVAFSDTISRYADQFSLDPSIIFGLIRQESVFDEYAGSSVGARGLMQIMPGTAKVIARQLQEPWSSDNDLYNPDTSIRFGTFYFRQLLDKFGGQVAFAAAGYNAGPGRIKGWLPPTVMPMDVWIESIPFTETRQYVGMVLANTIFYQQRLNREVLKISDFMNDVQPFL
jgi:soluble lytic murein transglycosylase